ncbi:MAG: MFS transporter, partial [Acidimicrobiales bacterium]|nr:MFS transporter [Acidimicrobiales bacterium]
MTLEGTTKPSTPADASAAGVSRREFLPMMSAIMALTALSIDMVLPAFDEMRETFGLEPQSPQMSQVVTVFFFGLAVGQLWLGPLSDRYGRKPVLAASISVYAIAAVASALAPSLGLMLVGRFVWAIGASGCRAVAVAIVRDVLDGEAMAKAMSVIMAVFILVPVIAPSVGSLVILVLPWQAIFLLCAGWAMLVWTWTSRLPETLAEHNRRSLRMRSLAEGAKRVATTRVTSLSTLASAFLQGLMATYLATSELIIGDIFDLRSQFPLIFGAIASLFAVGSLANGWLVGRMGLARVVRWASTLSPAVTLVLLAIAVRSDGTPPVWLFLPVLALSLSAMTLLMPNLNTLSLIPMGDMA